MRSRRLCSSMSRLIKNAASVLIVEDEALILDCAVAELQAAGLSVIAAHDAQEALDKFEQHPGVTTVFADVQMAGPLDGLSLVNIMSRLRPGLQLIVTTGKPGQLRGKLPAGAQFLAKPYDCTALAGLIDGPSPRSA